MKFNKELYDELSEIAFSSKNPGYKPSVIESPNGDGTWDEDKRYAHVAPKYFIKMPYYGLYECLESWRAGFEQAREVCKHLGIDSDFWPGMDSTLRILEYKPGATTAPHVDFDLFTLCLYRNIPETFRYLSGENDKLLTKAKEFSPGIHFGELMTEINGSKATKHEVVASDETQYSMVFFAVPDHAAELPSGVTVGEWMEERKNRSRKTKA